MPSADARGDYCLAAENGEELSGWVEAITNAMAAASLAALGDEGDPQEEEVTWFSPFSHPVSLALSLSRSLALSSFL